VFSGVIAISVEQNYRYVNFMLTSSTPPGISTQPSRCVGSSFSTNTPCAGIGPHCSWCVLRRSEIFQSDLFRTSEDREDHAKNTEG